jgi:hypothetical protein
MDFFFVFFESGSRKNPLLLEPRESVATGTKAASLQYPKEPDERPIQ